MLLALSVLTLVALALTLPLVWRTGSGLAARWRARPRRAPDPMDPLGDPGRERRAEQRARELLRSCVNDEEWAMYRDLGFIRVAGALARRTGDADTEGPAYAYLVYAHKPIVAYVPASGRLLSEYCVEFPDLTGPGRSLAPAGLR